MARAVLPNPSARAEWLFAGTNDRALHQWGHVPALDGGPGDHDSDDFETDTAIPDDADDIVSQRAARMNLCSHQVSNCPVNPVRGGVRLLVDDGAPTQRTGPTASHVNTPLRQSPPREQFRGQWVSGPQVLDLLALEDDVFQRCLPAQPAPAALQRFNRGKCARLLRDLDATADLPLHCPLFSLQLLDLTHRWWSESEGPDIDEVAAHTSIKLHSARYPDPAPLQLPDPRQPARSLTDLLAALAATLGRRQPRNVPPLHTALAVHEVVTDSELRVGDVHSSRLGASLRDSLLLEC